MMKQPRTRTDIYNQQMIDQLITLASKNQQTDKYQTIKILEIIEKLIQNPQELEVISQTGAFYFVCQVLKDFKNYDEDVIIQALSTLVQFSQLEDTCIVLIKYHKILEILSKLPEKYEDNSIIIQKLAQVLFLMMYQYPKCTNKISQYGFSQFFIQQFQKYNKPENEDQNVTLYMILLVLDRFAQDKQQIQFFIQQKFNQQCLIFVEQYNQEVKQQKSKVSDDVIQLVLNIMSSFVIAQQQVSIYFIQNRTLKMLLEIVESQNTQAQVKSFALSCFIEIFYANKGFHYSNVQDMLRTIQDQSIDQTLKRFVQLIQQEQNNDLMILYAQLIKMICSVPKRDDFIRQILLQFGLLKIFTEAVAQDFDIKCQTQILEAMSQLLCAQKMDKETLLNDAPKTIAVVKRIKREWQSKQNKKDFVYQSAIEAARKVLEKLGDQDGRDNKKATYMSWIIVCVSVIVGASISLIIH